MSWRRYLPSSSVQPGSWPPRARPRLRATTGRLPPKHERFEHPQLKHGVLTIEGTKGDDTIVASPQSGRPDVLQVDVGDARKHPFHFKRDDVDSIYLDAGDGNDAVSVDEANGVFTDTIATTLDGGDGNDTLAGGSGAETLIGSGGSDSIDGNRGADKALMGSGDDTFVWDPGDGSDVVEGQDGSDTMVFNGAAGAEQVDVSANGSRLRFFRNPANITMDTAGVETVDFNALGGTDTITVNDLSGTGVSKVNLDLAGSLGGLVGDGQVDRVTVNGTAGDDIVSVSGDAAGVSVSGLPAQVAMQHQDPVDELVVNGAGGTDSISAAALAAGSIALTLDGGSRRRPDRRRGRRREVDRRRRERLDRRQRRGRHRSDGLGGRHVLLGSG